MRGRAIGYLRVSTDKQADSGLGLEAQQAALEAAAVRVGLPLVQTFTDTGLSGALGASDRPALMEAVGALRRGDVLLVAKRDRLGRDVVALALVERLIQRKGARVVSAAGEGTGSDDPQSVLMRRLLDSFAEYERLIIGQRTKVALRAKRQRGERFSGLAPFGYRFAAGGQLEPAADEQAILGLIRECRAAGFSLRTIAAELNRQGVTTRSGSAWQFEYIRSVLKRAA
jgi:DNA invertase Pin-like site-specific DNA recombinase